MPDNQYDVNLAMAKHTEALAELIGELGGTLEWETTPEHRTVLAHEVEVGDTIVGPEGGHSKVTSRRVIIRLTTEHGIHDSLPDEDLVVVARD